MRHNYDFWQLPLPSANVVHSEPTLTAAESPYSRELGGLNENLEPKETYLWVNSPKHDKRYAWKCDL